MKARAGLEAEEEETDLELLERLHFTQGAWDQRLLYDRRARRKS
jgi:hypothetical protein